MSRERLYLFDPPLYDFTSDDKKIIPPSLFSPPRLYPIFSNPKSSIMTRFTAFSRKIRGFL